MTDVGVWSKKIVKVKKFLCRSGQDLKVPGG
jgi:hypothetical protein